MLLGPFAVSGTASTPQVGTLLLFPVVAFVPVEIPWAQDGMASSKGPRAGEPVEALSAADG